MIRSAVPEIQGYIRTPTLRPTLASWDSNGSYLLDDMNPCGVLVLHEPLELGALEVGDGLATGHSKNHGGVDGERPDELFLWDGHQKFNPRRDLLIPVFGDELDGGFFWPF